MILVERLKNQWTMENSKSMIWSSWCCANLANSINQDQLKAAIIIFFFLKFVIQREQRGSRRAMEGLSAIGYLGSYSGLGGPHWLLTAFN